MNAKDSPLIHTVKLLIMIVWVFSGIAAKAQPQDEGKIVVKITKEVNGKKKTFEGEYNSTEEMQADETYQEFAGENEGFNFSFNGIGNEDLALFLNGVKNSSQAFFHSFQGNSAFDSTFFFNFSDGDSTNNRFFNLQLDDMDLEEYREHMKQLGIDMSHLLNQFEEETREIKRVKVSVVGDEFGKKGKVQKGDQLALTSLRFNPNPSSNGRFKMQFELLEEGELAIRITNVQGKEILSRYFSRVGGLHTEMIDLSRQESGVYLLEISQGDKRMTKKIEID